MQSTVLESAGDKGAIWNILQWFTRLCSQQCLTWGMCGAVTLLTNKAICVPFTDTITQGCIPGCGVLSDSQTSNSPSLFQIRICNLTTVLVTEEWAQNTTSTVYCDYSSKLWSQQIKVLKLSEHMIKIFSLRDKLIIYNCVSIYFKYNCHKIISQLLTKFHIHT